MSANSIQIGGSHYKLDGQGEEHWDRQWRMNGRGYFVGCITKYVERYHKKNGVEDLRKARHFLDKLIELEEAKDKVAAMRGQGLLQDPHVVMSGNEQFESEVGVFRRAEAEIISSRKREGGA